MRGMDNAFIQPVWPAPDNVRAFTTTRNNPGQSDGRLYNLALHVGDNDSSVIANRITLRRHLQLPSEPVWLKQVHGREIIELRKSSSSILRADASFTKVPGIVCVVLTADCLPILLCDELGSMVAAIHAGWRGLFQEILAAAVQRMTKQPERLMAWLGPAIGPSAYEIDETVFRHFEGPKYELAFHPSRPGHWFMDLYAIARQQLNMAGVKRVYGASHCTYNESSLFFSYRRDAQTGRQASLIWMLK